MEYLFFINLILLIYVYLGYPLILAIWSRFLTKATCDQQENYEPHISIMISAFNEESCIENTISNKLGLDYPQDKLELIVISDSSSDATDEIVRGFEDPRIKFFRQSPRQGKSAALNIAESHASGEILIFSDANSVYQTDALKKLVRRFSDPEIGYVTGKMIYTTLDGSVIGDGCDAYMKYENYLREHESKIGSIVGVDGGIDAMRKEIFTKLNADQLPDFVQPLNVIRKGYRVVYEPEAVLRENALTQQSSEYKMRVRVTLRALWAIFEMKFLLNPLNYPQFSWQLWTHKVLRYLAWFPIMVVFLTNVFLVGDSFLLTFLMLGQMVFYSLAFAGYKKRNQSDCPLIYVAPYYFLLINLAAFHAFLQFIRGKKQVLWTPRTG